MQEPSDERGRSITALDAIRHECRQWLRMAGEKLDPSFDPAFQLMLWGLDQGLNYRDWSYTSQLRENVEYLAFQEDDPNVALTYIVKQEGCPDDPFIDAKQLAHAGSPEQASALLLEALDSAMTQDPHAEGWPPIYPKAED